MSTSIIIEQYDEKGQLIFRAFQCKIDPEEFLEDEFEDHVAKMERDQFLKTHDPNRIDRRRINKPGVVNLGLKVNRIKEGTYRRRLR